eukprot:4327217-Prorocentrum_lima.AAC.1
MAADPKQHKPIWRMLLNASARLLDVAILSKAYPGQDKQVSKAHVGPFSLGKLMLCRQYFQQLKELDLSQNWSISLSFDETRL